MRFPSSDTSSQQSNYLYEIQGLRTVAALLVAIYHIWLQRVSGGVDVFFVVAAYFMTLSLLKWSELSSEHINQFYLSTFKRVFPGASVVILCSIILATIFLQIQTWRTELHHALASILFKENWRLAETGTSYLTQGLKASIFQQMWALSVQMQIYLVFPLLIVLAYFIAKLRNIDVKTVALGLFIFIFICSFSYSIYITETNHKWAYFDSFARVWEFCTGAILALIAGNIRLNKATAWITGMLALLILVSFPFLLDVSVKFPGYIALIPTLAASAIIISARNKGNITLLNNKIFVILGNISFSFYLWHWPLLIVARQTSGDNSVNIWTGLFIILIAGVLAFLTTKYIEKPFRNNRKLLSKPRTAYAYCFAFILPGIIAFVGWQSLYRYTVSSELARLERIVSSGEDAIKSVKGLIPSPEIAALDRPASGCHQRIRGTKVISCQHGNPSSSQVIALVGGSHSLQWYPVLKKIADIKNYRIVIFTKSACYFADEIAKDEVNESCRTWNKKVYQKIAELKPMLVFTTSTRPARGKGDYVPDSYVSAWEKLAKHNIPIFALRDNPWFKKDIPSCLSRNKNNIEACSVPRDYVLSSSNPTDDIQLPNVYFSDLSQFFCTDDYCPGARKGITIYRDTNHITRTFALYLRKPLMAELDNAIAQLTVEPPRKLSFREAETP